MNDNQMQAMVLKAMGDIFGGMTQKTVSGPTVPPNHIYGHGAGGLFNTPCVDRALFSAMTLPRRGLASLLPVFPSQIDSPQVGIITGVTATDEDPDSNDAITGECGRGPSAGNLKLCVINDYPFGDYSRSTKSINIRRAGRMACRTDTFDYSVIGNPFNANSLPTPYVPGAPGMMDIGNAPNGEAEKALFELGVAWSRDMAKALYAGNPAGAWNEWSRPFRGLDLLINDNYADLISGNDCPRVDSIVQDFATWTGGTVDIETHAAEIMQAIVEITAALYRRASLMGLDPIRLAVSMPYNLFRKLTYLWPCSYYTGWCTPATGYTGNLSVEAQARLTQEMQDGMYLLVGGSYNGGRLPVVVDDAIAETPVVQTARLDSTIYWVTTHVLSTRIVTYMEYFNYAGPFGAMNAANRFGQSQNYMVTDAGRFLLHRITPEGTCIQLAAYTEPRVRVDTPYLCARLHNVEYTPFAVANESPFPEDSTFLNGGNYGPNPGARGTCATITDCDNVSPGVLDLTVDALIYCADAPFNTNVKITLKDGTVLLGYISAGGDTLSPTVTFEGFLATITCSDFDFVGATICCNFGTSPT